MKIIRKHYGTIELGSSVILSDPCYDLDEWCSGKVQNMIPGIYDCYADFAIMGSWGTRVVRLILVHTNVPNEGPAKIKEVPACLAVDAGVFGIYDEQYFRKVKDANPDAWYNQNVLSWINDEEGFICEDAKGFITTSGYGDGYYDAYCYHDDEENVYKIEVVFIDAKPEESISIINHVDNETTVKEITAELKEINKE